MDSEHRAMMQETLKEQQRERESTTDLIQPSKTG